jgi:hypothetical protein
MTQMNATSFPQKVQEHLKYYVYMYSDPRTGVPFYVGKGKGNRIFSHFKDGRQTKKTQMLEELRQLGLQPVLEVVKYGLSEKEALLVESATIDVLGLEQLSNLVHGYGSQNGRTRVDDLIPVLSCAKAQIREPSVLITINKAYRFGMSPHDLYDVTRSAWKVNPGKDREPEYAMAVFRGIIREVYSVSGWVPGGSTMRFSDKDGYHEDIPERLEFVGKVAEPAVRKRYVGKSVSHLHNKGAQNPIKYLNC